MIRYIYNHASGVRSLRTAMLLAAALLLHAFILAAPAPASASELISLELDKGQMVRLGRTASTVMVADPSIADIQVISPRMVYVHAKKVGETSLYAIDSGDQTILDATVAVTHNISKLEQAVKQLVPDADVNFKTVDGGLVMSGYADSTEESENIRSLASTFIGKDDKLVNMVTTAGSDQVTLMVKVVEVNRNELKNFGINLMSAVTKGGFAFSLLQGRNFIDSTTGNIVQNSSTGGAENELFSKVGHTGNFAETLLDALETQGLVTTLAEPSLTTTSGKTANFLAGGEFPIPIVDSQGQVSVQYKPFGVSLNFTPIVLSKDKISLTVAPEVSAISQVNSLTVGGGSSSSTSTFAIPSIQTRRAETSVELGSGQTFAIAGLLQNDRSNNISKFPGLGDMPVLGALFRSHSFQNNQSELVIMVTPFIVRPVSNRDKIKSPLDGYVPPSDLQRLLMGDLYESQPVSGKGGSDGSATNPDDVHGAADPVPENIPTLYGDGGFMVE